MTRCALLIVVAALSAVSSPAAAQVSLPPNFADETIVVSLDLPNSMAFLPDGRLLFTELNTGKIRLVVNGHLAGTDPAGVADSVSTGSERGLQGIAIDPRWPTFPYVYVSHTHTDNRMVLVRYAASGDVNNPSGENLVLSSKRTIIHDLWDLNGNHNGLCLRFATDGKLLMSTGDDGWNCAGQFPGTLRAKMLRLDVTRIPAGSGGPPPRAILIPPDNPFIGPDSNACLEYATALRNPWRFHVDPLTGAVLIADVGESLSDELDELVAGGNYGWPYREGNIVRTSSGCTEQPGSVFQAPILALDHATTDYRTLMTAGVYRPVLNAPSNWPSIYNGNLFYSDFYESRIRRLVRSGSSWIPAPPVPGQANNNDWASGFHFAADFLVGPDGSLWWLKATDGPDNTGQVKRIRYTGTIDVPNGTLESRALAAAPNPFRDGVELRWTVANAGPVKLEVFDPGGRRVRSFESQGETNGNWVWDGRDQNGVQVPAGLYMARLHHSGRTESVRVLRLR